MPENSYFVLTYDVVKDYVERRAQYRKDHITLAQEFVENGHLVLGGALEDPSDKAILIFYAPSSEVIEAFAKRDPYVTEGLVTKWSVRKWKAVVGTACKNPIKLVDL